MEIFKNKFLVKLIATICLFLTLFNFAGTSRVYAAGDKSDDKIWGGVLINPIVSLMTSIGDSIMEILHVSIQEQKAAIIRIDGTASWFEKVGAVVIAVLVGVIVAVAFIAAVVATGGAVAAAATALLGGTATATFTIGIGTVAAGAVAGICAGVAVKEAIIPNDIYLPLFAITAEEIFANRLALFDVNFFSNDISKYGTKKEIKETGNEDPPFFTWKSENQVGGSTYDFIDFDEGKQIEHYTLYSTQPVNPTTGASKQQSLLKKCFEEINKEGENINWQIYEENNQYTILKSGDEIIVSKDNRSYKIKYTQESQVNNVNNGINKYTETLEIKKVETIEIEKPIISTAMQLKEIIAKWYYILRNIALLVLMLVLIYSGIRIVLGSTAGEKAKYKERLMDWIVAICLIFIMQYIMVFAVEFIERITKLVGNTVNGNVAYIQLTEEQRKSAEEVLQGFNTTKEGDDDGDAIAENEGEHGAIVWPTDLAGLFRIESQMTEEGTSKWVGYSLCYVVLVLFTLFFAFTYLRRVLYMAFLTIIAPLVAMTYPIDKITDGKAQAFDSWLKEYIFNLMIQPLHLLLYVILVSSAYNLATTSPVYALVAVGFMMPAEKLMRKFFGFEKAKTPGLLGGAAGAAIAMSGLQSIMKPKGHGGHEGSSSKTKNQNTVKMANRSNIDVMEAISGEKPSKIQPKNNSQDEGLVTGRKNGIKHDDDILNKTTLGNDGWDNTEFGNVNDNMLNKTTLGNDGWDNTESGTVNDDMLNKTTLGNERWDNTESGTVNDDMLNKTTLENDGWDNTEFGTVNDDMLNKTTLGNDRLDNAGFGTVNVGRRSVDESQNGPELDEDDILNNTTMKMEDWDHDGFNIANVGRRPVKEQREKPEQDQEKKANIANKRRAILGATGAVLASTGKQLAGKALTGIHPLKLAGKLAAGATAATAGMLLGVTSGDVNKTFQYTTAGAMAGSKFADSLSGRKILDTDQIKEEAEMAYYGPEYKQKIIDDQRKAFQKDALNINYLRKTMGIGKEEAKEILNTTGIICFDNNITDIGDIATIHKLTHGDDKMSFEQAAAARHYAKKRLPANVEQLTDDAVEQYKARWEKEYNRAGYANGRDLAEKTFDLAIRFNKAHSNLTKAP